MKKILTFLGLLLALAISAQNKRDPRSIHMMGVPIEGPIDSLRQALTVAEFAEWGQSDDGEDYYFRGNFYGIRAKLMVSITPFSIVACTSFSMGSIVASIHVAS